MKKIIVPALLAALIGGGCYSSREVLNEPEGGLESGMEVRWVTTIDGERVEFADVFGDYGMVGDSAITGFSEFRGPVCIPREKVKSATVKRLNVFATGVGILALASVTYLLIDGIFGSSAGGGGSSCGGGGG